jgi:N-acetylmuramoyl-L-alanine amidase
LRRLPPPFAITATLLTGVLLLAQGTPPPSPLILLTRDGRRPLSTTIVNEQELVALDDLASLFQLSVREDALGGGATVGYKGRTIVLSPNQPMASVNGRLVSLPAPPTRSGRRWLVPVEFLPRALAPIYDSRIELRKPSRLLIVGDLRVPRVSARIDSAGPPTRVAIDIGSPTTATVTPEAGRLTVRIDADALDPSVQSPGGLVDQIRVEPPNLVIVQLKPGAGPPRATTTGADKGIRVTIDIPAAGAPVAQQPEPSAAPPPDVGAPLTAPRPALQAIVIDPGHGGDDSGAKGAGGTLEKQLTLDVARRIKTLVEARLGVRVILTREDDRHVGPDERAALANNSKADLLLSIHANAALASSLSGAEVYYLSLDREGQEARRAAESESVSLPVLGGGTRTIDVIRWDLAQASHIESSATLATFLSEELRGSVPMSPRGTQQAPMRVLVGANMPAALIEIAYLTNASQEKQVVTSEFQTSVTQAIYTAILRFRGYLESRR